MALTSFESIGGAALAAGWSGYVQAVALAANTAESITVPAGATKVRLTGSTNFYANPTTTATVPTDTSDGTASVLNPDYRGLSGVTAISVISDATCIVTAEFWS